MQTWFKTPIRIKWKSRKGKHWAWVKPRVNSVVGSRKDFLK